MNNLLDDNGHSKRISPVYKYLLIILVGLGSFVLFVGITFKVMSWPGSSEILTIGVLLAFAVAVVAVLKGRAERRL